MLHNALKLISNLSTDDVARIYELTYKYQMLEQEERLGDWGVSTLLPDRAYMSKEKIKYELSTLLDEVQPEMVSTYDWWIERHEPSDSDLMDSISESNSDYLRHDASIQDLVDMIDDEEKVVEIILNFIPEEVIAEAEKDPFEEASQYRDMIRKKTGQEQGTFTFEEDPKYKWEEIPEIKTLKEMSFAELYKLFPDDVESARDDLVDAALTSSNWFRSLEDQIEQERESYEESTALGQVREFREELADNWDDSDLSDKIIMFQTALTTMHNNGEMAEYLIDRGNLRGNTVTNFLKELSAGPEVENWNRELSKVLGHPPGETMSRPEQLYASIRKHFARVWRMLGQTQDQQVDFKELTVEEFSNLMK